MDAETAPTTPPPPPPTPPVARPGGFRLGRVLGVPVYLRASWLLLAVIVVVLYGPVAASMLPQLSPVGAYSLAVGFVLCLLLSVLLHELGHAIVARRYGIGVRAITLELLGGYTEMDSDSPHARADLWVSVIGPIVSAVLGAASLAVWSVLPDQTILDQLAFQLAWSNLIVAVFNALPGLPLDGGRALRALVWAVTGDRHAGSRVAGWIGRGVAVATLATGFVLTYTRDLSLFSLVFLMLVALTLWQGASVSIAQGRLGARLPRVDLRQLAQPVFPVALGTPLAEASRRAAEAGRADAVIGVTDADGLLLALVHEQAAQAVPAERRPWVPVESVARTLEPGRRLAADLSGEDVVRAVQANPAPSYLVVAGDDVVGVLRTADLVRLLKN
jgi:Zn-dependent protease